ncbi:MAG: hypothetical protein OXH90_00570 [Paracoccaceae bacterium]|nr:hypothetical protein [Paracoccaceae bacterium]MDE2916218.1 hypothetical protein [Paracoccaceae bacterium]
MEGDTVNTNIAKVILSDIEGNAFEGFANEFLPAILGPNYIPAGGFQDGGSDGFVDEGLFQVQGQVSHFAQISVTHYWTTKIKSTIDRLKETGRNPKKLTYFTSQNIPNIDLLEDKIFQETSVVIKIYALNWLLGNLNKNFHTRAAYKNHLAFFEQKFFKDIHKGNQTDLTTDTTAYVFLRQEIQKTEGNESLVNAAADSLILWALEGTDPDKNLFLSCDEIQNKIETKIPAAKNVVSGVLQTRLRSLSKKGSPSGREIRHHKNPDRYALPFKARQKLNDQIIVDKALEIGLINCFEERLSTYSSDDTYLDSIHDLARVALRTIQKTFEEEGLEFSQFLSNKDPRTDNLHISDHIETAAEKLNIDLKVVTQYKSYILECLKASFYRSHNIERQYFSKLSQTYALLFSLRAEPRIIEFFQNMSSSFRLIVGTDIIVRALSERFLLEADQQYRNMLRLLKKAGANLILTETVLEEVQYHIKTSDTEYKKEFEPLDRHSLPYDIARNINKILIRAYLYAKADCPVESERPKTWAKYINRIVDYKSLHKPQAKEEIKRFLINEFEFDFVESFDLESAIDSDEVDSLASLLIEDKQNEELARNDALLAHYVYSERRKHSEISKTSHFGFQTWWLTEETRIMRHTKELVKNNSGSRYIIRPQFILYFFSLAPQMTSVRNTFSEIFPSLLGIRLASRVKDDVMDNILEHLKQASEEDESTFKAKISIMADKMKSDMNRNYPLNPHFFERDGVT